MANESKEFKPYISADRIVPEFTATSLILGAVLAIVFGASNAYLGLRVGLTVSASIPAAVISMGIIRVILRRDSILENNMVQTIGSAGESLAAGAIFTMPALFLWAAEGKSEMPSLIEIFCIALVGGILGVMFMIPLRKALIVEEHGTLPYPEGTACAEVLLAGEQGGSKASTVFAGLGIAAGYKFVVDGLHIFPSSVSYDLGGPMKGGAVGMDILPALVGVGYICGPKISSYMVCGGILSWLVLMPLIHLFGGDATVFPGEVPISEMGTSDIWTNYVKYIGAGAIATGGIISLIKSLPLIVRTFSQAMKSMSKKNGNTNTTLRTDQDLSMITILVTVAVLAVAIWLIPVFPVNLLGAVIVVVFGFFFATVSSRLVGLIGSSNNPVSGMAIATILITSLLFKLTGATGISGMLGSIAVGSIICIVAAIAGDTSQDLKTGYIVGATPKKQQLGELLGVVVSAVAIGGVLYLLNSAWGFGSADLPAPQGTMMKMLVEGVMNANLPWTFIFTGAFIAIFLEILAIPVLPFAVGMYLPLSLNVGIMAGGLIRLFVDKKKGVSEEKRKENVNRGILYTSGMIAGEGLVGILLAIFAIIPVGAGTLADVLNLNGFGLPEEVLKIVGLVVFAVVILGTVIAFTFKKDKESK